LLVATVGPEEIPPDRYPLSLAVSSDGSKVHFLTGRYIGQVFGGSPGDSGESSLSDKKVTRSKFLRDQLGGVISPDGAHVATMKRTSGGTVVEINGIAGPKVLGFPAPPMRESGTYTPPLFSQNGRRLAYAALLKEGCMVYVVDQKPGECFTRVGSAIFDRDGSHFAFVGLKDGKSMIVIDGIVGKEHEGIAAPAFSQDGRLLVYWAQRSGAWYLVIDGREEGPFEAAKTPLPTFSPEGKLLYVGVRDGKVQLVFDGKKVAESIGGFASPAFSSTGRLAIYDFDRQGVHVLVDGNRVGSYSGAAGGIAFSPDGHRLAYGVKRDGAFYMVVDGTEYGPWQGLDSSGPVFSPDSKHVAWAASREGTNRVVVDGIEAEPTFRGVFRGGSIVFTSPNRFHVLVLVSDGLLTKVARVEVTINPPNDSP
jgi:Tol biopolymer transport system component